MVRMIPKIKEKHTAIRLRKDGMSLNEIKKILKVSKSSISLWVRDTHINKLAIARLKNKQRKAAEIGRKAMQLIRSQNKLNLQIQAKNLVSKTKFNDNSLLILCAMLYWCEGGKTESTIYFTNSDPNLVRLFLNLLRKTGIDEKRLKVCVHLHDYHDEKSQLKFWSKATKIPLSQFTKPYRKKNGGQRIRDGYPGCVSVRYGDGQLTKLLRFIAKEFMSKF